MMGALIVEDILAVLLLALLPNFASGSPPTVLDVALWIGRGALLIATLIIFGVYIAPRIIDRISQLEIDLDEAGFLLSLSLGFAMALLATLLGFSAGTGAFLMGLVIVGKRADFVYVKIRPVRDLFLVIFFVTMGILLDVSELLNIFAVLVVIATSFLAKYLGAYLGSLLVGEKQRASDVAIGMVPRGEFNLILAREASTFGVASTALYSLAGMTVLGTTLLSSLVQLVRQRRHRPR